MADEFEITEGEKVELSYSGEEYFIELVKVNDSRCPADATCMSTGDAVAVFLINNHEVRLCNGDCRGEAKPDVNLLKGSANFKITLKDIQPYPFASRPSDKAKTATLKIDNL